MPTQNELLDKKGKMSLGGFEWLESIAIEANDIKSVEEAKNIIEKKLKQVAHLKHWHFKRGYEMRKREAVLVGMREWCRGRRYYLQHKKA